MTLGHFERRVGVWTTNLSDHPSTTPLPQGDYAFEGALFVNTFDYKSFRIRLVLDFI